MERAIASTFDDARALNRRSGLGARILAINALSVLLVGASFLLLDSYRNQLVERRLAEVATQTGLAATGLSGASPGARAPLAVRMAADMDARLRIYDSQGRLALDSWRLAEPNFTIADTPEYRWAKRAAARLDEVVDAVVFAERPQPYREPDVNRADAWPEVGAARRGADATSLRLAPDRTAIITAAEALGSGETLLATVNARDLRRDVRAERLRLATAVLVALLITALLSAFLTRTIVAPIRRLAVAAQRVRQGRRRDVTVPRMTERRDEIGLLARALSDMTIALRDRVDSIEAFAADVTHELKNPLASLSSAAESLERVEDPALMAQLIGIIGEDARRMDRLVGDVADASRLDATLARSLFEPVDLTGVLNAVIEDQRREADERRVRLAFARPRTGSAVVAGLDTQLRRAFDNVVGNAVSFAPPGSLVDVRVRVAADWMEVSVEDEGPGVPESARESIFARFHSDRPSTDQDSSRHSGLGLAIARAVIKGHGGSIEATGRWNGRPGARFVIRLPLDGRTSP